MTQALVRRFDEVVAVDVSPEMVERARALAPGACYVVVSGDRLDGVPSGWADVLVCYLVLQHLPTRRLVVGYLEEFARVLAPEGEAFVQLPVLGPGTRARLWRAFRSLAVPPGAVLSRRPTRKRAFRGVRLTRAELERGLTRAGLRVVTRDEMPSPTYRFSREVFLRLARSRPA
jgi:SAM-dependent methyltransferase